MTRVTGDPKGVEATDPALLKMIGERGREYGAIHHRFYGSDREVLVAGVTDAPKIDFWRAVDVDDAF